VLVDDTPRGPAPHALVEQRIKQGLGAASVSVAEVGASGWKPFRDPAATVAQPPPALAPAPADQARWAPPAAPLVLDQSARAGTSDWGELPAGEAIHAGFWRRCAAFILDSLILLPLALLIFIPIIGPIFFHVGRWLYFALMESSASQATLGKRAMGIKAVDKHGGRLSFGRATGRYFGGFVSYIIFYVGYMMAGWTERKQALHDMMAETFVVFNDVQPSQPLPAQRPPMPWYGWVIIFVLPTLSTIAMIGILAAIALPAYQDYTTRAKVAEAMAMAEPVKMDVAEQIADQGSCKAGRRDSPSSLIEKIEVEQGSCTITLTLGSNRDVPQPVRGGQIEWTHEDGDWSCSSNMPQKYLPATCRK
jgi:uncharacterized RDD family membrane protein YckC/Tfp pilus assembly major pilin PilA